MGKESENGKHAASVGVEEPSCLQRTSMVVDDFLYNTFYKLGTAVARRPYMMIVGALLFTAAWGAGFIRFEQEGRAERLWVPQDRYLRQPGTAADTHARTQQPCISS